MKNNEEQRVLELRSENFEFNDNDLTVSGYVNKAGDVSKVIGKPDKNGQLQFFYETIDPQAFIDSINNRPDGRPIDLYADHDPQKLLATTDNGSLELNVDDVGLHMRAQIVNTNDGRDAYELIKSGIMGKMSFGFTVKHAVMDYSYANTHKYPLRKVDSLDLMEVSAVRFPAYLDTNIEARNSQEVFAELEKRGFNVSNLEFDTNENGENNLNMNFEEMKSDEIRSIIEHGKQELERRESSITTKSMETSQGKVASNSPITIKFDEETLSQLSEIRFALAQLTSKGEAPAKEGRDDEDLDTDADKQAEEEQKKAEKPEEKSTSEDRACGSEDDKKEEDRAKCDSENDKKEDRECKSEDDKKEEDRACGSEKDKKEKRSMPSNQPPLDEHQQEINSIIGSLKELFR